MRTCDTCFFRKNRPPIWKHFQSPSILLLSITSNLTSRHQFEKPPINRQIHSCPDCTYRHISGGRRRVEPFHSLVADHRVNDRKPEEFGHVRHLGVFHPGMCSAKLDRFLNLLQLLEVRRPYVFDFRGHFGHAHAFDSHAIGDFPVSHQPIRSIVVRLVVFVPQQSLIAVQMDKAQRHLLV